ncbi:hypothetical protein Cgig2_012820 [Carnegiea gigantea]|uniref:Uncharacterized protein n=1 Tax=Carnegiea gigantea TaxID=171969 RepID=A0A9Q1GML1_9CARY|nr:hypothetical protein Cgig2_012820 [Carnegiea gigantea]
MDFLGELVPKLARWPGKRYTFGVLYGRMIEILESALIELWWCIFEEQMWNNRGNILRANPSQIASPRPNRRNALPRTRGWKPSAPSFTEEDSPLRSYEEERERNEFSREKVSAPFSVMVFLYFYSTEQIADHIRETFKWHLRGPTCPLWPLSDNYHDFCSDLDLVVAAKAAGDFRILEMVQAIFYAMVVNEALELDVLGRDLAEQLKSTVEGLRWYVCEAWLQLNKHALLWAQYYRQVNPGAGPGLTSSQEENSGSTDTPPLLVMMTSHRFLL